MQKLKLSPETVAILKNFAGINKSILIRPGNTLTTISETKSIIGVATIKESFESEFAIADLPRFQNSLSLFSEPELEIGDKQVTIRQGSQKLKYTFDDKRVVLTTDAATVEKLGGVVDKGEIEFPWNDATYQTVKQARSVLNLPEFVIEGDGSKISVKAQDTSNSTGNTFEAEVGETDKEFRAVFRHENIKFLPRDYAVKYATRGLARFQSTDVTYYVTTESKK